eukprot:TRINITY_DN80417_c0_g1_i1.p1 TRINITY_DN80417_c0_g1~~TRINITY_DN80417_c0_g1_i1.p1  ORF type:complete len:277 (+),score=31.31 TRINITY_DN80417_c0_g1_i1:92-922(+)
MTDNVCRRCFVVLFTAACADANANASVASAEALVSQDTSHPEMDLRRLQTPWDDLCLERCPKMENASISKWNTVVGNYLGTRLTRYDVLQQMLNEMCEHYDAYKCLAANCHPTRWETLKLAASILCICNICPRFREVLVAAGGGMIGRATRTGSSLACLDVGVFDCVFLNEECENALDGSGLTHAPVQAAVKDCHSQGYRTMTAVSSINSESTTVPPRNSNKPQREPGDQRPLFALWIFLAVLGVLCVCGLVAAAVLLRLNPAKVEPDPAVQAWSA